MTINELTASIDRLPADSDITKIVEAIQRDGGVIVTGMVEAAKAQKIADEMQLTVDERSAGWDKKSDEDFWGSKTVRIQGIVNRSATWVDAVLLNPTLLSTLDQILGPNCGDYHVSQAELIYLAPGERAQTLHRDDVNWLRAVDLPFDLMLNCLVALGDYDNEVGATRIVPGSHLWDNDREVQEHEIATAEMELGDCFLYTGRVLHGGGDNDTTDRTRKALYNGFTLGWLTQEEAIPMTISPKLARTLPARAQELLGLTSMPNIQSDDEVNSAMQLWQVDPVDVSDFNGAFRNR